MIMILRHSKLHMLEICGKICRIYAEYTSHICTAYFAKFRIFSLKKFCIF